MATLQDLYGNAWQDYYKQPTGGSGWNPYSSGAGQVYRDPNTGTMIRANYNDAGDITHYFAYDPKNEKPGGQYMAYDPSGKQLGAGEFGSDEATKNLMMFLAAAGGMSFLPGGPFGNSLGGGAAGGPNFSTGFTDGGTAGGALDSAYAGTGGGGLNFSQGFTDGGTAGGALDAGYATGSAGTPYTTLTSSGVVPNATGGATSLLPSAVKTAATSLIPEGAKSLLGPAATIAGALAGGQGTPGQTTEKKMDPRLDQYVYGDLMPKVQGLLNSQMPLAQQAGQQMRQIGGGLLSAPIAGNGFNMFTKGRY